MADRSAAADIPPSPSSSSSSGQMSENGVPTSSPSPELQQALVGPLQSDPQLQASPMFGGTALQPSLPTLGPLAPTVLVHAPHFHWQATTVQ